MPPPPLGTLFSAYLAIVIAGVVFCSARMFVPAWRPAWLRRAPVGIVPGWNTSWSDFGIFLAVLVLWITAVFGIVDLLLPDISPADTDSTKPTEVQMVVSSLVMQAGFIALFWLFPAENGGPPRSLARRRVATSIWMGRSLFLFLLSLPAIFLVGTAWIMLLTFMQQQGYPVDVSPQDAVSTFSQAGDPIVLAGMIFLAVILAPMAEELIFRGAIYRFLKTRVGLTHAMFISGTLFAMVHFHVASFPMLVLIGFLLCITYEICGTLLAPILFHALFNTNSVILILLQGPAETTQKVAALVNRG